MERDRSERLERGREVWSRRGSFKREVQESDTPRELLAVTLEGGVPDFLDSMRLVHYVCLLPRIGLHRATGILEGAGLRAHLAPLGGLTERQRSALAQSLRTG